MLPERLDRTDRLAVGVGVVAIGLIAVAAARHARVLEASDPGPALARCSALVTTELPGASPALEESFAWVDWDRSDPARPRPGRTRTYPYAGNRVPTDRPYAWQVRLVVDEALPRGEVVRSYHHCELGYDPRTGEWTPVSVGPVAP